MSTARRNVVGFLVAVTAVWATMALMVQPTDAQSNTRVIDENTANPAAAFNQASSELAREGGGTIKFASGTYVITDDMKVKDNVHVRFASRVTLLVENAKSKRVFWIPSSTTDCSIVGATPERKVARKKTVVIMPALGWKKDSNGQYVLDGDGNKVRKRFGDGSNFAGIDIGGQRCSVENLTFVTRGLKGNMIATSAASEDITLRNIHATDDPFRLNVSLPDDYGDHDHPLTMPLHPGWSVVQSLATTNMVIDDMTGVGGWTVRLEQDDGSIATAGYRNIKITNIKNVDGKGALMLIAQGGVIDCEVVNGQQIWGNTGITIANVSANGSAFSLKLGNKAMHEMPEGPPSSWSGQERIEARKVEDLERARARKTPCVDGNGNQVPLDSKKGFIDQLKVSKIHLSYGENGVYARSDKAFLPSSMTSKVQRMNVKPKLSFEGPSIAPVILNMSNKADWDGMEITNISYAGFPSDYDFSSSGGVVGRAE